MTAPASMPARMFSRARHPARARRHSGAPSAMPMPAERRCSKATAPSCHSAERRRQPGRLLSEPVPQLRHRCEELDQLDCRHPVQASIARCRDAKLSCLASAANRDRRQPAQRSCEVAVLETATTCSPTMGRVTRPLPNHRSPTCGVVDPRRRWWRSRAGLAAAVVVVLFGGGFLVRRRRRARFDTR